MNLIEKYTLTVALVLLSLFGFENYLSAQYSDTKLISKSFSVERTNTIEVNNRYGDITIDTWNKDSINVDIRVYVSERSVSRLNDKMRSIDFNISQSGQFVVVNSVLGSASTNVFLQEFARLRESFGVEGPSKTEIHIKITTPEYINLRLVNKFGNIYVGDYSGDLQVEASNGKFIAQNLEGFVSLKINFGDAIVQSMGGANAEINYGKFSAYSVGNMRLYTKTSDISIDDADELNISSSRDSYRLKRVGKLDANANWTDFSVNYVNENADFRMNFGVISLDDFAKDIDEINVDSRSTKVNIYVNKLNTLGFDINSDREPRLPADAVILSKEVVSTENTTFRIVGCIGGRNCGTTQGPSSVIKNKSGSVNILNR